MLDSSSCCCARVCVSVTTKVWQHKQFKNIFKIVLKAASGLFKRIFSIFVGFISFEMTFAPFFLPKVRLNAPENVKWYNHKTMIDIQYFITYSVFKWTEMVPDLHDSPD